MSKSLFILEDCAQTIEDYEEIIKEINYRFSSGSLDFRAKAAILKRVKQKIEELKSGKDN